MTATRAPAKSPSHLQQQLNTFVSKLHRHAYKARTFVRNFYVTHFPWQINDLYKDFDIKKFTSNEREISMEPDLSTEEYELACHSNRSALKNIGFQENYRQNAFKSISFIGVGTFQAAFINYLALIFTSDPRLVSFIMTIKRHRVAGYTPQSLTTKLLGRFYTKRINHNTSLIKRTVPFAATRQRGQPRLTPEHSPDRPSVNFEPSGACVRVHARVMSGILRSVCTPVTIKSV